jgi:hypothetical protein
LGGGAGETEAGIGLGEITAGAAPGNALSWQAKESVAILFLIQNWKLMSEGVETLRHGSAGKKRSF